MTLHTEYEADATLGPISASASSSQLLCPDCGYECGSEEECDYNRAAKSWLDWADEVDPGEETVIAPNTP